MWPQTTQGHGQQQPSLSVVTTVWGVTSSMTNGTANMTHDPTNPGIPTTNTVNSVGHPYLSTSANPKQYAQSGKKDLKKDKKIKKSSFWLIFQRVGDNLLHSTFAQCFIYNTVKLQVDTEL